jgi:hypothetical protein
MADFCPDLPPKAVVDCNVIHFTRTEFKVKDGEELLNRRAASSNDKLISGMVGGELKAGFGFRWMWMMGVDMDGGRWAGGHGHG